MKLPKDANENQIKKQFRKLAREYHPDNAATGDEEKYMELVNANDILSDPEKRKQYDMFGSTNPGNMRQHSGGSPVDLSQVFNFFNRKGGRNTNSAFNFGFSGSSCVETTKCI